VPPSTVLIVEDDADVRQIVYRTLADAAYRVYEAGNGEEALAVLRLVRGPVDLAFLDIGLPDRKGLALAYELQALNSSQKILLTSGDLHWIAALAREVDGAQLTTWPMLPKPFGPDVLLAAVAAALATPAASPEPKTR
jgi:two-component system OmpR family response regulator